MKLLSLLDTLGSAPALTSATPASRRTLLRGAGHHLGQTLLAGLPVAATLPATARPTETVFDSLSLLLTLADLQAALFTRALDQQPGLVPAAARPGLERIRQLQRRQAAFLRGLYASAGAAVPTAATFDFSGSRNGSGPVLFPDTFASFDGFLRLAQPLADAAAGAYLGQLPTLRNEPQLFGAALRRQAAEARQAAHLRTLRRGASPLPKSWPSPTDPAAPAALQAIQRGEDSTQQLLPTATGLRFIDFYALFSYDNPVQTTALAEAFDEPLPTEQVGALLTLFRTA